MMGAYPMGIIPARAGFTPSSRRRDRLAPDHPRSRGVYWRGDGPDHAPTGSSPLARGLPPVRATRGLLKRIIPARAGFTAPSPGAAPERKDHPRSRGVYEIPEDATIVAVGSSPLARGLHEHPHVAAEQPGIIPARAGFTGWTRPRRLRPRDHPRSRGVYLTRRRAGPPAPGIIPARAGFTLPH